MKASKSRLLGLAIAGVAVIAASGCGSSSRTSGGGSADSPPPPPPAATDDPAVIPASAGASSAAYVSYVKTLETDEVTTESKSFASGFSEPAEDGDEPVPAS